MIAIKKKYLDFLNDEINFWTENNLIDPVQAENILNLYEVKKKSPGLIMLIAGLVLLFFGVASFTASKWNLIPDKFKLIIIGATYLLSFILYFIFGASKSHAARAFLLLGSGFAGFGLFLVFRIYKYKLDLNLMLEIWIGIIYLITLIFRDLWQMYFLQFLSLGYFLITMAINIFALQFISSAMLPANKFFEPVNAFILIILLWLMCIYLRDRTALDFSGLLTLGIISSRMTLCFGNTYTLIFIVIFGMMLSLFTKYNDVAVFGILMAGISGLLLTWPEFWRGEIFSNPKFNYQITSAIITGIFMLIQIYRGNIIPGGMFFALLAGRYFFDKLFGYIPKAYGFSLAGLIFLFMGFAIFRRRK